MYQDEFWCISYVFTSCDEILGGTVAPYEAEEFEKALYQKVAPLRELFVSFVVSQVRDEDRAQFRNHINLPPSIGCPRHCRNARKFFILLPLRLLYSSRVFPGKRKAIALVDSSFVENLSFIVLLFIE